MPTPSKSTNKPTTTRPAPTFGKTPTARPAGTVKPHPAVKSAAAKPTASRPVAKSRPEAGKPAAKSGVDYTHFSDKMTGALKNIKEFARDAQALARKIDNANELVQKVLPGVERALTTADISGLQTSAGDVAELTRVLQDMIPTGNQ